MLNVSAKRLRSIVQTIFAAAGAPDDSASLMAEVLVGSNLAGHDSHGVLRVPVYVARIKDGGMVPDVRPTVVEETETTALVDGRWTFGHVAAHYGTEVAIRKAKQSKISLVSVVRCHHIGRLGEWVEQAAEQGVISVVMVGGSGGTGPTTTAPFGGAARALGTNPIAFGAPAGEMPPMTMDIATSFIAEGKIQFARAKNADLPPGAILDKHGRPSVKPADFYDGGMLLPFGEHKGYSIAMLVELLCGALAPGDLYAEDGAHGGTVIIAIDPGTFRPDGSYEAVADFKLRRIKEVPPAPGFDEVLLPGEPELRAREERTRQGVAVPETTWDGLFEAGKSVGVDIAQIE